MKSLLERNFVGLQIPATWLAHPGAVETLAPVLDVVQKAGRPVLVHPGPVAPADREMPAWCPAVVDYPAQLQAAW